MMRFFYLLLCLSLVNCATAGSKAKKDLTDEQIAAGVTSDDEGDDGDVGPDPSKEAPIKVGKNMPQYEDLSDSEADMKFLPADINQNVDLWVNYFQGKGREHMVRYLSRSTRYAPKMKEILKSHGLPEDLVYIALIESGFNASAFSRARASGYWQFIRGTARRYDLKIDYYRDERNDFIASTEAASQYLKALYNLFGSWYLAMASYNVGENRIKKVVMKYYTRDFWEMARMKKLPKETIHYVPKFLAARMIAKHPEKFGFTDVEYMAPLDYQEVTFDKAVSLTTLATELGMDFEELHGLNPSYKKGIIPKYGNDPVMVRVPSKLDKARVLTAMENSSTSIAMAQSVAVVEDDYTKYRIRSGDTLSTISRRFRVSMGALIEANEMTRKAVLRVGKTILIPQSGGRSVSSTKRPSTTSIEKIRIMKAQKQASLKKNSKNTTASLSKAKMKMAPIARKGEGRSPAAVSFAKDIFMSKANASTLNRGKTHKVRSGETLLDIASKYKVRMSKLIAANKLQQKEKILIGSTLVIPQ
jgi:membrane-bound lytic murein transglycosylase D